jgi:prolyl oligopeptidase
MKARRLLNGTHICAGNDRRAIPSLPRSGSGAVTLREFDMDAKRFVADGFVLPEAKSGVDWVDGDMLLLSRASGEDIATTSGYSRTVRLWRRGETVEQAPVVFEVPPEHMSASSHIDDSGPVPRTWFVDRTDFFNLNAWLADERGAKTKLDLPTSVWLLTYQDC